MSAPAIKPQWAVLEENACVGVAKAGERRFWTGREELLLREHFPKGGLNACAPHLPGRTAKAIYQRARQLGLVSPHSPTTPRVEPYRTSEHIDAAIRRAYTKTPTKGDIAKLSQTLMRPRWWVGKRAVQLGLMVPRFRALPWSVAENDIVREHEGRKPSTIQAALKAKGFIRSEIAVQVQMKRLGVSRAQDNPDIYNSRTLAELFGVDSHLIVSWINKGWLKAKQESKAPQAPWIIRRKDVRIFIVENVAAIDIRRCDKFWLVDVLAGAMA